VATGSVASGTFTVWQTKAGLGTTGTDGGQWAETAGPGRRLGRFGENLPGCQGER